MIIYADILPPTLGRAMYRINKNMRRFAPEWVTFTEDRDKAELQILDIIGRGSLEYLYKDNYIILQHCFLSSDDSSRETWLPVFAKAKLVATYMNLPQLIGSNSFNFHRIPWGADSEIFYKTDTEKIHTILTTGYVASTESINEVYDALKSTLGNMVHIGSDFKLGHNYKHFENISDESLTSLYNKSYYVSGLRKMEGFELPILEGLLCGTRGICYNKEHYSHWFGDLVEYVEEDDYATLGIYSNNTKEQLEKIFSSPYRSVTNEEIEFIKNKFSWKTIFDGFWKEVEHAL